MCVGCHRAFVAPRNKVHAWCHPSCKELHALRGSLPRNLGKRPPLDPDSGRCMNCNRRLRASRWPFWCDGVCESEWRARLEIWKWRENLAFREIKRAENGKESAT